MFIQKQITYAKRQTLRISTQSINVYNKSTYVYLTESLPLSRFYLALSSALVFLCFFFLNTRQATIELYRAPVKGDRYNKNYLYARACEHGRRRVVQCERRECSAPHPFMGYWFPISPIMAGAHPFFFLRRYTCWTPNACWSSGDRAGGFCAPGGT